MIRIKLTNTESHIENEDYFSLRIVYDSSVGGVPKDFLRFGLFFRVFVLF